MRFKGQWAAPALVDEPAEGFLDLAFAFADGDDFVLGFEGVLHVESVEVREEPGEPVGHGAEADEDGVGEVERGAEVAGLDFLEEDLGVLRIGAPESAVVFVEKDHAVVGGEGYLFADPVEDFVSLRLIFVRADFGGEEADSVGAGELCSMDGLLEFLELAFSVLWRAGDLVDGGADAADVEAELVALVLDGFQVVVGEGEDIEAVDATEVETFDAEAGDGVELDSEVGADFVGETGEDKVGHARNVTPKFLVERLRISRVG